MDDRLDKLLGLAEQQHATIAAQGKQIAELTVHVGMLVQAVAQLLGEEAGLPVEDEGSAPERRDLDGNPY
ncbi:hypothetical protein [uncultured Stenotrophomonas sp.]|uniref:hypothetical protein n=1 Tax=uncultured Stenotrophomonas sp. TaxID=165438 RepID=UPI0025F2CF1A|nr:hypothetical protein [uncultured Stenotrophomonas sp.]